MARHGPRAPTPEIPAASTAGRGVATHVSKGVGSVPGAVPDENTRLTDFSHADDETEAGPSGDEGADSGSDQETGPGSDEKTGPRGDCEQPDPDDEGGVEDGESAPVGEGADGATSAVSTSNWTRGGRACETCGTSVERRWREDGALVCVDCKAW